MAVELSHVDESSTHASTTDRGRMVFVDVLRVALIVLVIAHHSAQAYGPTGGSWPVEDPANSDLLGPFFAVNAAFFMGLLFFLAGYFAPGSYDRKGPSRFVRDRWARIGVPLVFFVLVVNLPTAYMNESPRPSFGQFLRSAYGDGLQDLYWHLWFLGHLLLYTGAYVAWRKFADDRATTSRPTWSPPNHVAIIGFVAGLALVTFFVRGWYSIDEWVPLFGVLATEPAHLPQYVALFALGIVAYRGDWLRRWSTRTGMIWLAIGLIASVGLANLRLRDPARYADVIETGGFNWESLLYSTWEAVICAGLSVGLVVLFRTLFRRTNRFLTAMTTASMAAYVLHLIIVVGLQSSIETQDQPALLKFAIVTAIATVLAFGLGHLSRRTPGARTVLGTSVKTPQGTAQRDDPVRSAT